MSKQPKPFIKGYKYRIYPTDEQKQYFAKAFGNCRFVWNQLLAKSIKDYEAFKAGECSEKPNVSSMGLTYGVKALRNHPDYEWLKTVSNGLYQQTARDLGQAFSNFFANVKKGAKVGYPKFKKKGGKDSFRAPTGKFDIRNGRLRLEKCPGTVEVVFHRELPSTPSSCTVSRNAAGEYYVSFTCEFVPRVTNGQGKVGIDLGLTTYATLSTGDQLDNPKWMKASSTRLRRAQQSLSRKKLGSNNRNKAKHKVACIHNRVANQRDDWQHNLSRTLVNENQVIGVESLRVVNMVKNRHLSKAISDAAWFSFIQKLLYKVEESQHCELIMVGTFYPSSHLCSNTGEKLDRKLKLSERSFKCPYCDEVHDRDVNAAKNILTESLRLRGRVDAVKLKGATTILNG